MPERCFVKNLPLAEPCDEQSSSNVSELRWLDFMSATQIKHFATRGLFLRGNNVCMFVILCELVDVHFCVEQRSRTQRKRERFMGDLVFIKVVDGKRKTYFWRKELREKGLLYSDVSEPHWFAEISEDDFVALKKWCFKRGLGVICSKNERSKDYRDCFFESGQSTFLKDKYFCSYCGRLLSKEQVCVDHLISVKKGQVSFIYDSIIERLGFESINDVKNLVPACRRCNSRKGAKGGSWVLRGLVGRFPAFWLVFRSAMFVLVILFLLLFGNVFA